MPTDIGSILIQLFSGLSRAMMLFLLSSGLSLIFGVMNILNFAHATLWLLGGYLTYTLFQLFSNTFGDYALLHRAGHPYRQQGPCSSSDGCSKGF